jgi:crotonobetainyl-CoA:carnitine CoA-transferase CaiB-like acyl-CoA transferase
VILDLTHFLAGPYGTQILGDLGARIIKIEPPEGDSTRHFPPHFVKGQSAYFLSVNRNKESVVIDLKQPAGRDLLLRMVARADVVMESFRPGVMARLGLDYEKLAEVNPGIVLCSITGFGQDGPYSQRPAYDIIVQALSGGMSLTGEPDGRPVRAGIPLGDLAAGMSGVIASLAALAERAVSGKGQHIDISMLDCQISMLVYQGVYHLVSGEVPGPQGRGHASIPTYRSFTCSDGVDIVVAANTEKMWQALCQALGLGSLADEPRFRTNAERFEHREDLWARLEPAFRQRTADAWLPVLYEVGIPAAPVNGLDRALRDPQVLHRRMVTSLRDADGVELQVLGNPIKLSRSESEAYRWPPDLGEHTRSVLEEFVGLAPGEVHGLMAAGVVKGGPREALEPGMVKETP